MTLRLSGMLTIVLSAALLPAANAKAEVGSWKLVGAPEGRECVGIEVINGTAFARMPSHAGGNPWDSNRFSKASTDGGSEWLESEVTLPAGEPDFVDPILVIGSTMYGHCAGDIYTSDDNGQSWTAMTGPSGYSTRYAHIYWSGSLLSTGRYICDLNAGTWEQVPKYSSGIHQFLRFGKINDRMVAVSSRTGVFYSDDNGQSWSESSFAPECISIYTMNDRVYAVAGDGSGLYVSTDGGATFSLTSDAVKNGFLKRVGDRMCCVGEDKLYWISQDGKTVTESDIGPWTRLNDVAEVGEYHLAATDRGIFRSVDEGLTWYAANRGLGYQTIIRMSAANAEGDTLYCATKSGVWRSVTYGEGWKSMGLFDKAINDVVSHDGKIYAVDPDNLYIGTPDGSAWETVSISNEGYFGSYPALLVHDGNVYFNNTESLSLISGSTLQEKATDPGKCWIASGHVYSDKAKRTSDFASWEDLSGLNNPEHVTGGFAATGDHVYAAMIHARFEPKNHEAYRSEDGVAFTGFDNGLRKKVGSGGDCWLSAICAHGDTVFAYEEDGGTNPPRIMYATVESTGWKAYANLDGQISITRYTNMIATTRCLHLGAYRYDFENIPPAPDTADTNEYIDPLSASAGSKKTGRHAFATISGPYYGQLDIRASAGFGDLSQIQLITPRGRVLWSESHKIPSGEGLKVSIPITGVASGVYFVRIRSGNNQSTKWISIRR